MGRRAKHKQGDPVPFSDPSEKARPSAKKLGKRKAEDEGQKGSVKKVKAGVAAADGGKATKGKSRDKLEPGVKAKAKEGEKKTAKAKRKKVEDEDEEEDVDMGAGESGDGWEDVEDGVDLKAEVK